MSKWRDKDRSLTIRSSQGLRKTRQSSSLIDKHLSDIKNETSGLSKVVESIEFMGGIYEGQVLDGVPYGYGTWTGPEGEEYVGEWKDGKENGQGHWTTPDGYWLVGEFRDGEWVRLRSIKS